MQPTFAEEHVPQQPGYAGKEYVAKRGAEGNTGRDLPSSQRLQHESNFISPALSVNPEQFDGNAEVVHPAESHPLLELAGYRQAL